MFPFKIDTSVDWGKGLFYYIRNKLYIYIYLLYKTPGIVEFNDRIIIKPFIIGKKHNI